MKMFRSKFAIFVASLALSFTVTNSISAASHLVAEGDSIYSIADQYGVDPYQLAEANGMDILSVITPGQHLTIPGLSSQADTVVETSYNQAEYVV